MKLLVSIVSILLLTNSFAAPRYWVSNVPSNWNNAANWSATSGGAGGAGVPTATDDVFFDAARVGNCNIDVAVNILSITVAAGYTGTITQNTNIISVGAGGAVFSGGIFAGGTADITVNGGLSINGSNFTSTSAILRLNGATYDFLSGNFNSNNGTVHLFGGKTINGISHAFNNLWLEGNAAFTFNTNVDVLGIYRMVTGNIVVNTGTINVKGDININSTNVFGGGSGTILINGTGNQSVNSTVQIGGGRLPNVTFDKPSGSFTVNGNMSINGTWTYAQGLIGGTGLVAFVNGNSINGPDHSIPNCGFFVGNYTLNSNLTVSNRLNYSGTGNIVINGPTKSIFVTGNLEINNTGLFGGGSATIVINGTGNQTSTSTVAVGQGSLPNVTFDKPSGTFTLTGNTSVAGTWTYVQGVVGGTGFLAFTNGNLLQGPAHTLPNIGFYAGTYTLNSDITVTDTLYYTGTGNIILNTGFTNSLFNKVYFKIDNTGIFGGGDATIVLDGSANQTINSSSSCNQSKLPNIIINKLSGNLDLIGNISVAGNWEYQNGTVNPGTSKVCFYTSGKTIDCQGASQTMAFYDVALGDPNRRTLLGDMIVNNQLDLAAGNIDMNTFDIEIKNPLPAGINRTTGYLRSETLPTIGYSRVIWNIGNNTLGNNYVIPFGVTTGTTNYIPLNYNIQTAGTQSGTGKIAFATYPTTLTPAPNNRPLPTGVTNFNDYFNVENANNALDRFWVIEPEGYSTPPVATIGFTYLDAELAAPNTIVEANLKPQRWRNPFWDIPYASTINTTTNVVTTSVGVGEYGAFTLVTNPIPTITINASDPSICPTDCIDYTATITPNGTAWNWTFAGATPPTANVQNPTNICYATTGSNNVSLTVTYPSGISTSKIETGFITVNPNPVATIRQDTTVCEGASVPMFATGGVSYVWSPDNTLSDANIANPIANPTANTTYSVTVTDANGCKDTLATTVTATPSTLVLSTSIINPISCLGDTDGKLLATISGGNSPYDYVWSNNDNKLNSTQLSDSTDTGVGAGTYSITVTDNIGCAKVEQIIIDDPEEITVTSVTPANTLCKGSSDGSITVSASGGTGTLEYSVDGTFSTNNVISGLTAGNYVVTVRDSKGCTKTQSVTITEPTPISITNITTTNSSCIAGGSATVTASGGTGTLEYSTDGNFQTSNVLTNLAQGNYTLTVKDANGCTATQVFTISGPPALTVTSVLDNNVTCNGANDAQITATASGGSGSGFEYSLNGGTFQASGVFSGLGPNTYVIEARDDNGCSVTATPDIIVTEPSLLTSSGSVTTLIACDGGSGVITASAGGGTVGSGYQYAICSGSGCTSFGSNQATTTFTVTAGIYRIRTTDGNGCTAVSADIIVSEPAALTSSGSVTTPIACNGGSGVITASAGGGTAGSGYQYAICSGSGCTSFGSNQGTTTFTVTAGTYRIKTTDDNGCTAVSSDIVVSEPSVINLSATVKNVSCNGGSNGAIDLSVTGGTGPNYSYEWSSGGAQTQDLSNIVAGIYDVTVTDENGCTETLSETVSEPTAVIFTFSKTDVTCFGETDGTITISASGGSGGGYEFSLDNGGSYFSNNGIFTSVGAGNYTLLVKDGSGCTSASQSVTITEPTTALTISLAVFRDARCAGECNGLIRVSAAGGTMPYEYSFDNGTGYSNVDSIGTLCAGTYEVLVRDANGCTASLTRDIIEPTPLTITTVLDNDISCFNANDAQITATAQGGTPSSGIYQMEITGSAPSAAQPVTTYTLLAPGTYQVTVTDALGCTAISSPAITVTNPAELTVTAVLDNDITCFNADDAQITATGLGGTGTLEYNIGNGNQSAGVFNNLSAGSYTVTVTDASGCTAESNSVIVTNPDELTITAVLDNDITCFNVNDAQITATETGGVAPFQYNIGNGNQANGLFTSLEAGDYEVTVTDANGCTAVSNLVTVNNPIELTVTSVLDNDISCFNANDAQITATASGGVPNYQYNIGGGNQANGIFSGLQSATYTVTVTDDNGCTAISNSVLVTNPDELTVTAVLDNDISCFNANNAQITATGVGGTGTLQYNIGNGNQASGVFDNLSEGSYVITVTDASSCTAESNIIVVTNPGELSLTAVLNNDISCFNANDAQIIATETGGVGPFQYNIGNGNQASEVFIGLSSGSYTVTITDANGCTAESNSVLVTNPTELTVTAVLDNDISCFNANDAQITATAQGGVGGFEYNIGAGNQPTGVFTGLSGGVYEVTVTDANGCTAVSNSVIVTNPAELTVTAVLDNDISCFNLNDAQITVTGVGGTGTLQYNIGNGNQPSGVFNSLSEGSYVITVTDASGCTAGSNSVLVTNPTELTVTAVLDNDISCFNENDAQITATAIGGTVVSNYSFEITGGTTNTTGIFASLAEGSYTITVTDDNGCTATTTPAIDVTNPSEIVITKTVTDVRCFGETNGEIDITVSGGTPNYTFSWNNGAFVSEDIDNLPIGTYTVVVTDANGCTASDVSEIIQPDEIVIASAVTNVNCFGGSDGEIDITVSGGAGGFTFEWNDGNQNEDRIGLVAETYSVTVTDNNNCTATVSSIVVSQPDALDLSSSKIDISCNGGSDGSINVVVGGGTAPYSYAWSNGANTEDIQNLTAGIYCLIVTDANGCEKTICDTIIEPDAILLGTQSVATLCFGSSEGEITLSVTGGTPGYTFEWSTGETTQDLQNLPAGNYCVTVTDSRGCVADICEDVAQPDDIVITKAVTNVLCNSESTGAIDITITGGTGAYTFLWQPNNEVSEDLNGIPAGLYGVLVTDANGCQDTTTTFITEPSAITVTGVVTDVLCNGENTGAIDITVSGGIPSYGFSWNNGAFISEDLSGLPAGNYEVEITDANGCVLAGASFDIAQPAAPLEVTAVLDNDISCYNANDAQITATATGGTPLYDFSVNGSPFFPINVAPTLPEGSYLVVVRDANGCFDTIQQAIVVTNPPQQFITTVLDNDISCFNANDAQITATGSGGTGALEYSIDGNIFSANNVFKGLQAGSYTVTVRDATGCTAVSAPAILVTNPAELIVSAVLDNDITCFNFNDAQITATANGGVGGYEYSISGPNGPFQSSGIFNGLSEGSYSIDIRDANGCTAVSNAIVVTNPAELVATIISSTNVNCFGGSDGTATVSATGGTGAYSYEWSTIPSQNIATATGLSEGSYTVTVSDANSCTTSADIVITQPATPVAADATVVSNVSCFGRNDGEAVVTGSGGTSANGTYLYLWSSNANNQQTATASNLLAGTYFVTVIDDNGCEAIDSVVVTQPELLIVTIQLNSNAYCNGNGRGQLTANIIGGTAPFDYEWSNSFNTLASTDTFNVNTDLTVGPYNVTVTDANGCSATGSSNVFERPGVTVSSFEIIRSTCGNADGSISVIATTEDNPLTYSWSHDASLTTPVAQNIPRGNYTLTITDLATCDTVMNFEIIDIDGPQIDGTIVKDSYCENDNGSITVLVSSGTFPYSYEWDFSQFETGATVENLVPGTYSVTVTDANDCDITTTVTINNVPSPEVTINETSPQTILLGEEVQLTVSVFSSLGNVSFEWIPSRDIEPFDSDTVVAKPEITTVYQVWVTDSATGCISRDTITVIVRDKDNIFIPNAITPNGDGVNDTWIIRDLAEIKNNEVMIFSRWGDVLFTARPYNNDWDGTYNGKPLPAGTYYYILKLDDLGEVRDGNITIIR